MIDNKVDIILIRYNNPDVENHAIKCVEENTSWPYTLTVYDNYPKNIPLSTLWNRLIKKSKCRYVCLLNSDAFVAPGWLEEAMGGFTKGVAAVGPSGDNVAGLQGNWSSGRAASHSHEYRRVDFLSGFCLVIDKRAGIKFPREVPFYCGERAWALQAKRAGYGLVWAKGAFVGHLDAASIKNSGIDQEKLLIAGRLAYAKWLARTSPVLFTTYNRLEYSKIALGSLLASECRNIIIIDNNSTDGTLEWIKGLGHKGLKGAVVFPENIGVGGAMNEFLSLTENELFVGKVDNDTVVPSGWFTQLTSLMVCSAYDAIQAKHFCLSEEHGSFDQWMKSLPSREHSAGVIYCSKHVGGSGLIIRRQSVYPAMPTDGHALGGWARYQQREKLTVGFTDSVEVELLDMKGDNNYDTKKYPEYYKETGREGGP